jgi:hypothetical protein
MLIVAGIVLQLPVKGCPFKSGSAGENCDASIPKSQRRYPTSWMMFVGGIDTALGGVPFKLPVTEPALYVRQSSWGVIPVLSLFPTGQ